MILALQSAALRAEPLKVLTVGAFKEVVLEVAPHFKAASGVEVQVSYDTAGKLVKRVEGGEAFDVFIGSRAGIESLQKAGKIVAATSVDVATIGIGIGMKQGTAPPALATVQEFTTMLRAAKRIAYIDPASGGSSGIYLDGLFRRLGLAEMIQSKAVLVPGGLAAERIVRGEADVVLQQASEILPVPGVTLVGMLPDEVQNYTTYVAALSTRGASNEAAKSLLAMLTNDATQQVIRDKGMKPARSLAAGAASDSVLVRVDAAVDSLVAADAKLETIYEREAIFEGPVWIPDRAGGSLIFSDVPGNVINKWLSPGKTTAFLADIFNGKEASEAYQSAGLFGQKKFFMLGANGVTLDRQGRVVYCAMSDGLIVRLEADGTRTTLASRFAGNRLNAPNDLVYSSDGALYFTDSRADTKRADGEGVPHKGLYVLKAGEVQLLSKDIHHPNGLTLSPDEKYLYVTNSRLRNILRFEVRADGLANSQVFIDMDRDKAVGAPDGIKVDANGNVYSSGPGGVWIIAADGRHLGTIATPKQITNLTFGGNDFKTLYMTGFGAVYRIPLKAAGNAASRLAPISGTSAR